MLCASLLIPIASDEIDDEILLETDGFFEEEDDRSITGVCLIIGADISLGVHVLTKDPDNTSITAVNVDAKTFVTTFDYEEVAEGEYIYYLAIKPWELDVELLFDFTENFSITERSYIDEITIKKDVRLYLNALPETAKTISPLAYCKALLADDPSAELATFLADLLEYGRAAQRYMGYPEEKVMPLPEGLVATAHTWKDGEGNPCDFVTFCTAHYPLNLTAQSASASKKIRYGEGQLRFDGRFVATFSFESDTESIFERARMKVNRSVYSVATRTCDYAFSPAEYEGVTFSLYITANTTKANLAWVNRYGPFQYVAERHTAGQTIDEKLLPLLEAFYHYGHSLEGYLNSLAG